ncbi:cytosine permease [Nonomuraea rubra]|uniref:cytosine permease n=1 Tax=Nonomuraea rubra TaxID=46180 RepID=UPI0031EE1681
MSTGTTSLYGTGLDFSSVFPRFSRVQATVFIGTLSIVFIFIGRFRGEPPRRASTFATLIITCTAPWMVIMMLGYVTRRGGTTRSRCRCSTGRQRGGRYWFTPGWNWRGLSAWLVSRRAGADVRQPARAVLSGRWGPGQRDRHSRLPVGLAWPGCFYLALCWSLFPEPREVYGPMTGRAWSARPTRRCCRSWSR